ncbi:MAG: NAD(P)/FAD-dependent oxidoreductase [Lachnospiraceae bacterium]|nr:NAD(P)/FAD-dependent oxidoreductase [Lachnospiraceae bacterium]
MKVVVIGGGAAGMMAAWRAGSLGADVTVYEKNEKLGKKLFITGKGRCNVTNSSDLEAVFSNINRNPKFMYSSIYSFDNEAVMKLLESYGLKLKVERGNRVFPASDKSSDVIKTLERMLKDVHVKVELNKTVDRLLVDDGVCTGISLKDGKKVFADRIIVATGGLSYQSTGSTGDGYRFARDCGHTIVKTEPSLVGIETKEEWVKSLQGLSLKNATLSLKISGKEKYSELGEMLFTHFGISGPLVLSASAYLNEDTIKNKEVSISIDLKPGLSKEELDKRVLKDFEENINRNFINSLDKLLPQKLIPVIVDLSGIAPETKVNVIKSEDRKRLVELLKNLTVTPKKLRPIDEAIITRGGVNVKEVNPSTLESKLCKNLYFAGEVLDIDAMTGGYNLQLAWSTGYLAGTIE